ncbi:hypothetical protein BH09ACT12_BH09ACT12_29410 [soil metagenome]
MSATADPPDRHHETTECHRCPETPTVTDVLRHHMSRPSWNLAVASIRVAAPSKVLRTSPLGQPQAPGHLPSSTHADSRLHRPTPREDRPRSPLVARSDRGGGARVRRTARAPLRQRRVGARHRHRRSGRTPGPHHLARGDGGGRGGLPRRSAGVGECHRPRRPRERRSQPNLDHTFRCRYDSGEARVDDDESTEVGWFSLGALPPMAPVLAERIARAAAHSGGETLLD